MRDLRVMTGESVTREEELRFVALMSFDAPDDDGLGQYSREERRFVMKWRRKYSRRVLINDGAGWTTGREHNLRKRADSVT